MSKAQYWIPNLDGGVCARLVLPQLVFNRLNESPGQALTATTVAVK